MPTSRPYKAPRVWRSLAIYSELYVFRRYVPSPSCSTSRLFIIKRSLQRLVDIAALEVAARGGRCDDGSAQIRLNADASRHCNKHDSCTT